MEKEFKTTYIVSGYIRTGTSMMMKALSAGGLSPVFSHKRDEEMNKNYSIDNYVSNPEGFYELDKKEYLQVGFPRKYEGKLLKCLWNRVPRLVVGNYKIVFMLRDPEEIKQSSKRAFGVDVSSGLKNYNEIMEDMINIIKNRKDSQIVALNYVDVINNPRKEFQKLKDGGWSICVDKCVSVITPGLYRNRIKNG